MMFDNKVYFQALHKAPQSIQSMLSSDELTHAIRNIKNRNNIKDGGQTAIVIGNVSVGLVPIKRFIQALQEDAGLDEKTAKNVAHDVRAEIFAPVAKELAAMQEEAERQWTAAHSDAEAGPETKEAKPGMARPKAAIPAEGLGTKGSPMQPPTPKDESVVSEVFPAPEVDEKKFDDGLEKPEEK